MFKTLCLLLVASAVMAAPSSKIESRLVSTLTSKGVANILISYSVPPSKVIGHLKEAKFATREDRIQTVVDTLRSHSQSQQKYSQALLKSLGVEHEVFWITNQIYIRKASESLIAKLAELQEVVKIEEEFEVFLDPIIPGDGVSNERAPGILAEWGVENVEAPAAWALGFNGTGAIVGGIDTGVLHTHEDLLSNFVGTNYGWRDVTLFGTQVPRDDNGHGTHTMGSIVGRNGIGVAPYARWMACKALNAQGGGTNAGLISCGQFMACPTLPNGNSPDCTRAPHLVSNSWGGGQANPFYNEVINSWHTMNIIPIFANGNSGPNCQTANSPADSLVDVFGVGATSVDNEVASFSSKGPTLGGRQKPDIAAPGVNVRSAWHTGTTAYYTASGTSMAAPHVAGVVALLKGNNPNLTFQQIATVLYANTNKETIVETGMNCGNIPESNFPNMAVGHGIVNARRAVQASM